ncbi:MAG: endonuclease III [Candidatus Omnitrophica bacterium]|nr:endonuclease III [Candidatus Omnitrophota bacterium]MBD3268699.1 endonuclease III [Candidatus Omnitrophota bacterium]
MNRIVSVIKKAERELKRTEIKNHTIGAYLSDPYQILIAGILSSRTRDDVTFYASKRLFSVAASPRKLVKLSLKQIYKLIRPVGFYRKKSKNILKVSRALIRDFGSKVPQSQDDLLKLPGVGSKTANLVLSLLYHKPFICVDTHVHRVFNRLGLVSTPKPQETERALRLLVPKKYWSRINPVFVLFGQNICLPLSPYCSRCKLRSLCKRKGVKYAR